jgi:TolB protein
MKSFCFYAFALISFAAALAALAQPETAAKETSLSHIVQLTTGFDKAGEAYFSPDMNWIIFQAAPKGQPQYQMFVAKLKREDGQITGTETPIQISPNASRNTCGYFSPDGSTILFGSTVGREKPDEPTSGYQRQGGNYRWAFPEGMEIFVCPHWQSEIAKNPAATKVELSRVQLTHNDVYDAECAFSPDGKSICFASKQNNNLDIYVMPYHAADTANPTPTVGTPVRITTAPGYDGGPFFSPDGKPRGYRSDRKGNDLLQIFTADLQFDADGHITGAAAEHQLTDDINVNWGPFWHPDGHHLIYATSKHGHANYELYLMHDDGSHQTRITYSPGADVLPVFSPDGHYLMWTSKRSKEQTSQVFVARFTLPTDE